jgi:hypothetical protein
MRVENAQLIERGWATLPPEYRVPEQLHALDGKFPGRNLVPGREGRAT